MKKYMIAGSILVGGLFLMNGGGAMIGLALGHIIVFLVEAVLLLVFGYIGLVLVWRFVGLPLIGCAGIITFLAIVTWIVSLF